MAAPKRTPCVKALSKNVLQMKFMQRSSLKCVADDTELRKHKIDDEHWIIDGMAASAEAVVSTGSTTIQSYAQCEDLHWGRMSFKGFNPEVERIMMAMDTEQVLLAAEEREKQTSVSEQEMTARYQSLVGTIAKKFKSKKERRAAVAAATEEAQQQETAGAPPGVKDAPVTAGHEQAGLKRKSLEPAGCPPPSHGKRRH